MYHGVGHVFRDSDYIGAPNGISDNSKAQPYTFLTQLTLYIAKSILPHLPLSFSYHSLYISKKISTRGSPLGVQLPVKFRRRSSIRSIAKVSYDDATFHFCWGANVLSLSLSLTTIYLEPRPQNTFGQS